MGDIEEEFKELCRKKEGHILESEDSSWVKCYLPDGKEFKLEKKKNEE